MEGPARFHPVAGFGGCANALEDRVWADSRRRGTLFTVVLVTGTALPCRLATGRLRGRRRLLFATATLWCALGGRSLDRAARAMHRALAARTHQVPRHKLKRTSGVLCARAVA